MEKHTTQILYTIFPVVIFALISILVGITVLEPYSVAAPANIFATPLEILPEWYFLPTFNILRVLPDKFIGVISCLFILGLLLILTFIDNLNVYQNPFRRFISTTLFLTSIFISIWLGLGGLLPIFSSLPLLL